MPEKISENRIFLSSRGADEESRKLEPPPNKSKKRRRGQNAAEPHGPKCMVIQGGNDFKQPLNAKQDDTKTQAQSVKNGSPRSDTTRKAIGASVTLKEKAKALYEVRKNLPIFSHADEIREHLRRT